MAHAARRRAWSSGVMEAVRASLDDGIVSARDGARRGGARRLTEIIPLADHVRFVAPQRCRVHRASSRSRPYGRDLVVKVDGHFTAAAIRDDESLVAYTARATRRPPSAAFPSRGIPRAVAETVFRSPGTTWRRSRRRCPRPRRVAALIWFPSTTNRCLTPPMATCAQHASSPTCGALLLSTRSCRDSVGRGGAQTLYGVTPDITAVQAVSSAPAVRDVGRRRGDADTQEPVPRGIREHVRGSVMGLAAAEATLELLWSRLLPDPPGGAEGFYRSAGDLRSIPDPGQSARRARCRRYLARASPSPTTPRCVDSTRRCGGRSSALGSMRRVLPHRLPSRPATTRCTRTFCSGSRPWPREVTG